jgi:hypothetical protein
MLMGVNRSGFGCWSLTNIDNGCVEPTTVSVTWLQPLHSELRRSTRLCKHERKHNFLTKL